jgi:hypothetical protein
MDVILQVSVELGRTRMPCARSWIYSKARLWKLDRVPVMPWIVHQCRLIAKVKLWSWMTNLRFVSASWFLPPRNR